MQACLITQKLGVYAEDGPDDDRLPDWVPITGTVTLTPSVQKGHAFTIVDEDGSRTVPAVPYMAEIRDGELWHGDHPGIFVFAGGPTSNPEKVTYIVEYKGLKAGTTPVNLRALAFEAVPGGHVDLATVTPVAGTPGAGITRGEDGESPRIGPGGTWWIGDTDTGVVADVTVAVDQHLAALPAGAIETPAGSGLYVLTSDPT